MRIAITGKSDYDYNIYIDDVKVFKVEVFNNDVGIIGFVKSQNYMVGKSDSIGLIIKNFGNNSQNDFWVHYDLKIDPGRDSLHYTSTLNSQQIDTVFIDWTPQTAGSDSIIGWTVLSGDENTGNDTSKTSVNILESGTILTEGFESSTFPPEGWCMFGWDEGVEVDDPWQRSDFNPHGGGWCARTKYDMSGGTDYWLVSKRIDLSGYDIITLKFYHIPKYNDNANYLKITTQADSMDTSAYTILHTFYDKGTDWELFEIDLSDYAGCTIFIAWNAKEENDYEYWYLDDITIIAETSLTHDIKMVSIISPPKFVMEQTPYIPRAKIKNIGKNTETFKIFCKVDSSGHTIFKDSVQVNNLKPDSTKVVNFSSWTPASDGNTYTLTFYTALSNDGDKSDDTLTLSVKVVKRLPVEAINPLHWPSFMRDIANTGRTDCVGPDTIESYASYSTGGAIHSSPVIDSDGTVYFGSDDGYLYAMHPDLSGYKWRYETPGEAIRSTPAIDTNGNIYFGSNDNYFYSLDSNGNFRWRHLLANLYNVVHPAVIGDDQKIYIGAGSNFYAFNPDGSIAWQLTAPTIAGDISTGAALRDSIVYFGTTNDHYLYAVCNGVVLWKKPLPRGINSTPTLKGDTIFFALNDGKLYAIRDTGEGYKDLWAVRIDPPKSGWSDVYYSSPAVGFDHTIYVGTPFNHLVAVYPDGEIKWKFKVHGKVWSSPVVDSNGIIYFGSHDDTLYALEDLGSCAQVVWKFGTGGSIRSAAAIRNPLYFTSLDGKIYCINPPSAVKLKEKTTQKLNAFSLQVYPNPSNKEIIIRYSCPYSCEVSLKIYDVSGRLVKTLVNSKKKPGSYIIKCDNKEFPCGIYFIRMQAGEFRATKKLLLIQ